MGIDPTLDYYKILDLSEAATTDEITAAFRLAMKAAAADAATDPDGVQRAVDAYRVLSDPGQRAEYDKVRARPADSAPESESLVLKLSQALERLREQVDPSQPEAAVRLIADQAGALLNKLQVTKVRLKHKDKPVLPDIPLIYGLLLEAGGIWAGGLVRVLIANLGIKALVDVEVINEAEELVTRGDANYQAGEVTSAIRDYRQAVALDRTCAIAHYQLGVALRVQGDIPKAAESFRKVIQLDPASELAAKAKVQLERVGLL